MAIRVYWMGKWGVDGNGEQTKILIASAFSIAILRTRNNSALTIKHSLDIYCPFARLFYSSQNAMTVAFGLSLILYAESQKFQAESI